MFEQYAQQITDVKVELRDVGNCIFNIELTGDDPIVLILQMELSKRSFDVL